MRSLKVNAMMNPTMPIASDTLSSAASAQLAQFVEAGVGDAAAGRQAVPHSRVRGAIRIDEPVGIVGG